MPDPLPDDVIDEATRLTRLAHRTTTSDTDRSDERQKYRSRRKTLLEDYNYTVHVRDDPDPTIVFYPEHWVDDGTVDRDRIDDTDNAIQRPLTPTQADDYDAVAHDNQTIVDTVATTHGDPHTDNAAAFATFMNNHRNRRIHTATADDITEFLDEYYPRNTWPTPEQQTVICRSLRYTLEIANND